MLEWGSLALIAVLYFVGAYATFHPPWRDHASYIWLLLAINTIATVIYASMMRYVDTANRMYVYNVLWDVVMCGMYYLVPLACFGVQLDRYGVAGMTLVVLGSILLKLH